MSVITNCSTCSFWDKPKCQHQEHPYLVPPYGFCKDWDEKLDVSIDEDLVEWWNRTRKQILGESQ